MYPQDHDFLRQAIQMAAVARQQGEFPFGAILVSNQEVHHRATDRCIYHSDPTAHAERLLISEFCRQNRILDLEGFTIYSSTEPCILCAGAIKWARISRVVFSVSQGMLQELTGGRPKPSCAELVNSGGRFIEVDGPLLPDEGLSVFIGYDFKPKRKYPIRKD